MKFKTEIRGMSFFYGDRATNKFRTLAMAEVYIPELDMTIRDVRLAWNADRGFVAHSPTAPKVTAAPLIQWFHHGAFARDLTGKLAAMFERMGGEIPAPAVRRDHVTGKPIGPDPFEVAKAGGIERRVFPATFTIHEAGEAANDNEAVAGLHRTLGIEVEEAERACD